MATNTMTLPQVVSREEWLTLRKQHLAKEKAFTRERDVLNTERRQLPMVRIEKDYVFEGPNGRCTLGDLFEGRHQLIVYHFMFDPSWDEGCPSCSFLVDNIGHLGHLHARNTSLALVSRAPLSKIAPFKKRMGWTIPWYSSFGGDFNYDFHVTLDEAVTPAEYNYRDMAELIQRGEAYFTQGESHGLSVFLHEGDIAKRQSCLASRLVWRHAARDVDLGFTIEVIADLIVEPIQRFSATLSPHSATQPGLRPVDRRVWRGARECPMPRARLPQAAPTRQ